MYTCTMYCMVYMYMNVIKPQNKCNSITTQCQSNTKKYIFFFAQLNCVIRSKSSSSASIMSVYGRASIPERPG